MMKKTVGYLIIAFFMFTAFKVQAYASKLESAVSWKIKESNIEKGLMEIDKNVQVIVRPRVEYRAQGLRNPFEQPILESELTDVGGSLKSKEEKSLPELTVQGIIWGSNLPQAIVNNKVVKVGDSLESVDIVAINKEGVTVLFAGVEHKLTTLPEESLER